MPLEGKTIAMTGGSGGIGRALAKELKSAGARLAIVSRRSDAPEGCALIRADLSSPHDIDDAAGNIARQAPDILINMAGIQHFGPLEDETPEHLAQGLMVNLIAPVALTRAVLPLMKQRRSGHIVNVGSIFGSIPFAHFASYSAAKAGLHGFSQALRREVAGLGIAVTHIAPRAVKAGLTTPEVLRFAQLARISLDEPEAVARRIAKAIALRRKEVYIGFPESAVVRINALLPRLVDRALAPTDARARAHLFAKPQSRR